MNDLIVTNNIVPIQAYPTEEGIIFYDFKEQDYIQRYLIKILKNTKNTKKSKREATQVLQNPIITNNIHDAIRKYADKRLPELLTPYHNELSIERTKIYNKLYPQSQASINKLKNEQEKEVNTAISTIKKKYYEDKWHKIIGKEVRYWNKKLYFEQEEKKRELEKKYYNEITEAQTINYCSNYKILKEHIEKLNIPINKYLTIEEDKYIGKEILEILTNAGHKKILLNNYAQAQDIKNITLQIIRIRISEKLIAIIENILTNNTGILQTKDTADIPYTQEESDKLRTQLEIHIHILKEVFITQKSETEIIEDYNTQVDKYITQLSNQAEKIIETNMINTYIGGSQRYKDYEKTKQ